LGSHAVWLGTNLGNRWAHYDLEADERRRHYVEEVAEERMHAHDDVVDMTSAHRQTDPGVVYVRDTPVPVRPQAPQSEDCCMSGAYWRGDGR